MIHVKARDGRNIARDNLKWDSVDVQLPLKVCERTHAGRIKAARVFCMLLSRLRICCRRGSPKRRCNDCILVYRDAPFS